VALTASRNDGIKRANANEDKGIAESDVVGDLSTLREQNRISSQNAAQRSDDERQAPEEAIRNLGDADCAYSAKHIWRRRKQLCVRGLEAHVDHDLWKCELHGVCWLENVSARALAI
jgi:hypothetical protein